MSVQKIVGYTDYWQLVYKLIGVYTFAPETDYRAKGITFHGSV
jgi:hypothetical protein